MTFSQATQYWMALSPEQKQVFYNYASKSEGNHTAFEWFNHLVPDELKDDPSEIEAFMDGGTVVTTDGDVVEVSDKDLSRIESGHNGGDYTTENAIMEDSSINRARGAADITPDELESIEATNAFETEAINGAEIFENAADAEAFAEAGTDLLGVAGELLQDIAAPAIGAYMAGTTVAKHMETDEDKLGYGSLAAGSAALLCLTPIGQAGLGIYCSYKLTKRVLGWLNK